jgi:outer membrane protein assembly factor BamE (lipoprotein component of BamABCDE complex)
MKRLLLTLVVLASVCGCSSQGDDRAEKVWTTAELQGLRGKTRDDVREILGEPKGLYTYDSKDRWHYSKIFIDGDQPGTREQVSVLVYFSKFGEHRVTIVELRHRAEE